MIAREVEVLRSAPLYVMSPSTCDVTVAVAQTHGPHRAGSSAAQAARSR
jgi:hypothetical protein